MSHDDSIPNTPRIRRGNSELEDAIDNLIDGWDGFPDNPDDYTRSVMDAVQELHGVDLRDLTPEQMEQAELIKSYVNS